MRGSPRNGVARALALGCGCLCACGAGRIAPAANASEPSRAAATATDQGAPLARDPVRVLGASATFGDLARAARLLAERGSTDPTGSCLLHAVGGGYVLGADLMPALASALAAPQELDGQLREPGPLAALTAFGLHGDHAAQLAFEAWTAVAPERLQAPFALLVLGDEGVYARREPSGPTKDERGEPFALEAARGTLPARVAGAATCYVSAEADAPLAHLAQLLAALPPSCQAVLATVLPEGTRLPAPPTAVAPPRCPDGLPEPSAIAVEGALALEALREGLSAIEPAARNCLRYAPAQDAIRVLLALRIDARGGVEQACVRGGDATSPAFETCVVGAARSARFEPPAPSGFVDVHTGLALAVERWPLQRAFCEGGGDAPMTPAAAPASPTSASP